MRAPRRSRTLRILLAVLVAAVAIQSNGRAQDLANQIDALVQKYHDLRLFSGSVLVAQNGKVIYKKGFGYANAEWEVPNAPDTRHRIGSVTKQFTAALVLKLVEEGRISLDGKIVDYLPDYPRPAGEEVTIHHLLTHSSGIPNYTSLPDFFPEMSRDPYEPEEFIPVFSNLDLEFEPGSEWSYSNSGYFLLGVIIEKVTGMSYDEVLRQRLLEPLGLHDTGYDKYEEVLDRRASGYSLTFAGYRNAPYLDTSLPYAAGSLYSTVEDLFKWDRALYANRIFSDPRYLELMMTPHIQDYGYGLVIRKVPLGETDDSVKVVEHGGGINGFVTGFRRLVADRHLIVLMDNTSRSVADLERGITNLLYGQPAESPKASIAHVLQQTIDEEGIEAAIARYRRLRESEPGGYDFRESELNELGYYYLENEDLTTAIAVFKLNVEAYPDRFNTYDSLGEGYMKAGDRERAIENYRRSLELNPRNQNARRMLAELGVEVAESSSEEISLPVSILERYVGVYELQPGFTITITLDGEQLMARATGQPRFPIFPASETEFLLKVVDAQIEFHVGDSGVVESLTLHQGGRQMPGRKVE